MMDIIECIKKEYASRSMGELKDFIKCTINHELTKTTLKISQPDLINKTTQGFNKDMKSIMTFNKPAKPHKGIVRNQETDTKNQKIYRRYTGVA